MRPCPAEGNFEKARYIFDASFDWPFTQVSVLLSLYEMFFLVVGDYWLFYKTESVLSTIEDFNNTNKS